MQLRKSFLIIAFPPGMTSIDFGKVFPSPHKMTKIVLLTKFLFCPLPNRLTNGKLFTFILANPRALLLKNAGNIDKFYSERAHSFVLFRACYREEQYEREDQQPV